MTKRKLVLGFIFDPTFKKVLLIHKNRPDWQKGKLNGLGGKLNLKERKEKGIEREVFEESGLTIKKWTCIGTLQGKHDIIYCFTSVYKGALSDAHTTTDEKVKWENLNNLPKNVHPNLTWLIPLCIDILKNSEIKSISIFYKTQN